MDREGPSFRVNSYGANEGPLRLPFVPTLQSSDVRCDYSPPIPASDIAVRGAGGIAGNCGRWRPLVRGVPDSRGTAQSYWGHIRQSEGSPAVAGPHMQCVSRGAVAIFSLRRPLNGGGCQWRAESTTKYQQLRAGPPRTRCSPVSVAQCKR